MTEDGDELDTMTRERERGFVDTHHILVTARQVLVSFFTFGTHSQSVGSRPHTSLASTGVGGCVVSV